MMTDVPSYEVKDQHGNSHILHCKWLLLIASEAGIPLHVGVHQAQDRCTSATPVKPTPKGSDSKTTPQEDDGLVITQHQARKTSLGWISGKLLLLHGCQPEHPLRMGEVSRQCVVAVVVFIDRMAKRIMCVWWREGHQPIDTIR